MQKEALKVVIKFIFLLIQKKKIEEKMQKQNPIKKVKIQLYITRHGQTQQNKKKILCGQNPGKLTQEGIIQAQKIGQYFKNKNFHKIYVSDLGRTRQTFQNISLKAPHLKKIQTKFQSLIRQKHGGILTGQPLAAWDKQAEKQKKSIRQYKPKGGQSWVDVNKRVHKFIEMIIRQNVINKQSPNEQQQILVVCHGGYIMQFHNVCKHISSKGKMKAVYSNSAKNCSIHVFEIEYPCDQDKKEYREELVDIRCHVNNFTEHMQK